MVRKGVLTVGKIYWKMIWHIGEKITNKGSHFVYNVAQDTVINRLRYARIFKHIMDQTQDFQDVIFEIIEFGSVKGSPRLEWLIQRGYLHKGKHR